MFFGTNAHVPLVAAHTRQRPAQTPGCLPLTRAPPAVRRFPSQRALPPPQVRRRCCFCFCQAAAERCRIICLVTGHPARPRSPRTSCCCRASPPENKSHKRSNKTGGGGAKAVHQFGNFTQPHRETSTFYFFERHRRNCLVTLGCRWWGGPLPASGGSHVPHHP